MQKTMEHLLEEHLTEDLNQYRRRGAASRGTERAKQNAYGKCQYIFEKIVTPA
jgi:hypothetical protein